MKHAPGRFMYAYAQLRDTFGDEFESLNRTDGVKVAQDYLDTLETESDFSAQEYLRRIWKGNLQSYAKSLT